MTEPGTLPEGIEQLIEPTFYALMVDRAPISDQDAQDLLTEFGRKCAAEGAAQERARQCEWTREDDPDYSDVWETACGQKFVFNDGGPAENHFEYCGYCGGKLATRTPPPPEAQKVSKETEPGTLPEEQ